MFQLKNMYQNICFFNTNKIHSHVRYDLVNHVNCFNLDPFLKYRIFLYTNYYKNISTQSISHIVLP